MGSEQFSEAIQARTEGRYIVQVVGPENEELLALAPELLLDRQVVRLRRNGREKAGWRTVLIATLGSEAELPIATRWAAEVRDSLLEPETADLYMIISVDGLSDNVVASIEANEQFCRKFVPRLGECIENLLDRTFLGPMISKSEGEALIDPLIASLSITSERHKWLGAYRQESWHKALLSGKTGSDLFDLLLREVPVGGDIP
jgi:hypothetical protein